MVAVKLERCQQIFTRCLCWPPRRSRSSRLLRDTDMKGSVLLITHIVNLTTPISLSYGDFLLPWRFSHSRWPDSIIPAALCSDLSTHPEGVVSGSAPFSIKTGTYSQYSLSISLLFRLSLPLDVQSFSSPLISSPLPFLQPGLSFPPSLSDYLSSNPDQFWKLIFSL